MLSKCKEGTQRLLTVCCKIEKKKMYLKKLSTDRQTVPEQPAEQGKQISSSLTLDDSMKRWRSDDSGIFLSSTNRIKQWLEIDRFESHCSKQ